MADFWVWDADGDVRDSTCVDAIDAATAAATWVEEYWPDLDSPKRIEVLVSEGDYRVPPRKYLIEASTTVTFRAKVTT